MEPKITPEKTKIPIKAIIFDFDGLLIDSEAVWDRAYYSFLEQKGLKDLEFSQSTSGMGLREFIQIWKKEGGLQGNDEELVKEFRGVFYKILFEDNLTLMEGARDLLERLKGKYKIAVSTGGHPKNMVEKILKELSVFDFFNIYISSDDVKRGKPYPDVNVAVAQELSVSSAQCLIFEDSVNGVLAGKAAGMKVIGVNADEDLRRLLSETGADEVYSTLAEVSL